MADFNSMSMENMGAQKARNILAVNALRKAFGSLQVLKDISLRVEREM